MNRLAADNVAIHRLTVRSRPGGQPLAASLSEQLQRADWPSADTDSWVFIRRLQASGPARHLPGLLLEQTKRMLRQDGGDEVVRFASLAELLAALLSDLLQGRAGLHWYWRRWAHWFDLPISRGIFGLMSEHLALLPSICVHLAQRGQLAAVWLNMASGDARQLAFELAGLIGISIKMVAEQLAQAHIPDQVAPRRGQPAGQVAMQILTLAPSSLAIWRPVLQSTAPDDARYQLAILLLALDAAPLLLQRQPLEVLRALSARMSGLPEDRRANADQPTVDSDFFGPEAGPDLSIVKASEPTMQIRTDDRTLGAPERIGFHGKPAAKANGKQPTPAEAQKRPISDQRPAEDRLYRASETGVAARQLESESGIETQSPASQTVNTLPFDSFSTQQGGLLYLLNMLNRPELRQLMVEQAEILPSGWGWLYRLGEELDLDQGDALVDLIAGQLGFTDRAELASLPALPARARVLELAERWYAKTSVWQPELLRLAARIQFNPSHIDMYVPMSTVRLPVRLAGLDISPGWLPWLGRVVSFHYD